MNSFAREHRHPGFVWLAKYGAKWVARDQVPECLLLPHDAALAALDADPHDHKAAVTWLDACDAIYERANKILDVSALQVCLEAEMHKLALDAELRHRFQPLNLGSCLPRCRSRWATRKRRLADQRNSKILLLGSKKICPVGKSDVCQPKSRSV
jgi:hypothetical protein